VSARLLYVIRHCESTGSEPEAPLSARGFEPAQDLAKRQAVAGIQRIVSSPYVRARQTIEPLAQRLGVEIEVEVRWAERKGAFIPNRADWEALPRRIFAEPDFSENGESSGSALARGLAAFRDIADSIDVPTALVGHGQLSSLLLGQLWHRDPFAIWLALTNPDVFSVTPNGEDYTIERIWS